MKKRMIVLSLSRTHHNSLAAFVRKQIPSSHTTIRIYIYIYSLFLINYIDFAPILIEEELGVLAPGS